MTTSERTRHLTRSITATTFPAPARQHGPLRLDRVPASSMTSLKASGLVDLPNSRSISGGGSVGNGTEVVERQQRQTITTPFGLPQRVVSVLRQMSPHADRLTWTVAEGTDAVSLALAWDFTSGENGVINETGRRQRDRRSASCGDSRRSRTRLDEGGYLDRREDRDAMSDDDGKRNRRRVATSSDTLENLSDGVQQELFQHDGSDGTRVSFRFWRRLRTLAALSRPLTDDNREDLPADRKLNHEHLSNEQRTESMSKSSSSGVSRPRRRCASTSGSGNETTNDVICDNYEHDSLTTTNANCRVVNADRKASGNSERSSSRHQRMFTRCTNRLLELPLLRRLKAARRHGTVTGRHDNVITTTVSSDSTQANGHGDTDNSSLGLGLRGHLLLTSTSLPERINRQASVSAIVGTRRTPDRDSLDTAVHWYKLSHELHHRVQLDTLNLAENVTNVSYLRNQLRHRYSSRDLLTSPEAESITSSTQFPNPASAAVDHHSSTGRRQNHYRQPLQPSQRMTGGKRSSWPRTLHPPSSAEHCSVADDGVEATLELPPLRTATSTCRLRRLSRPRKHEVSLDQTSAMVTEAPTTVSKRRQISDASCHCSATEANCESVKTADLQRTTYRDCRTSSGFGYGRATETASMCSIDAIAYVSGPEACRMSGGGGGGSSGPLMASQSLDYVDASLSSAATVVVTSGGVAPQTSGVDCQTVTRCLDSCDKILLRHSTEIT